MAREKELFHCSPTIEPSALSLSLSLSLCLYLMLASSRAIILRFFLSPSPFAIDRSIQLHTTCNANLFDLCHVTSRSLSSIQMRPTLSLSLSLSRPHVQCIAANTLKHMCMHSQSLGCHWQSLSLSPQCFQCTISCERSDDAFHRYFSNAHISHTLRRSSHSLPLSLSSTHAAVVEVGTCRSHALSSPFSLRYGA